MKNATNNIDLPRELVIPTKLLFSKEIDCEYKQIYMYISYRASTRGYIWYQNETLADHIGKNTRSVKRALKALSDAKWIKIENRVKKSALYHQDMRRVIWIYSDYLVALDKGGYGAARPLGFATWKKRFIAAILNPVNIPLVLHFFPTMEKMGQLGLMYDEKDRYLFNYVKSADKKYTTHKLNSQENKKAYQELYQFYCSQHQKNYQDQEPEIINDFTLFQKQIREEYIDKTIVVINNKKVSVTALGSLITIDDDDLALMMDTDKAIQTWQWLFQNQNQIIKE